MQQKKLDFIKSKNLFTKWYFQESKHNSTNSTEFNKFASSFHPFIAFCNISLNIFNSDLYGAGYLILF